MRRVKAYPRYHSNYGPIGRPFRFQQTLSLNAGRRENLKTSALRLGSDGSTGGRLLPFTNRQLSENLRFRTVFVTAFFVLPTLYHVRQQKSNVFLSKRHFFLSAQFPGPPLSKKCENCPLTNGVVCGKMTSVHMKKTLTENSFLSRSSREPAGGASRCGWRKRSDSRVGSVNERSFSNGTRLPPLQG